MFQSLGGGICYIMGPLFVSAGESKASPRQLLTEILLCLCFFLVCLVSYTPSTASSSGRRTALAYWR